MISDKSGIFLSEEEFSEKKTQLLKRISSYTNLV